MNCITSTDAAESRAITIVDEDEVDPATNAKRKTDLVRAFKDMDGYII